MSIKFFCIFLLLFFYDILAVQPSDKIKKNGIDTVIVIKIDLTGDDKEDSVLCRIKGEAWDKPFSVEYKVKCDGNVIYSKTSSDEFIDKEFSNNSAIEWCKNKGYLSCKKEWYLSKMAKECIKEFPPGDNWRKSFFDTTSDNSLAAVLRKAYIDSLGLSPEKISEEINKVKEKFKSKNIVYLIIPPNPVYKSFPRFYDPVHKIMVQLYGF